MTWMVNAHGRGEKRCGKIRTIPADIAPGRHCREIKPAMRGAMTWN
jgi:hypothetical protein